MIVVCTNCHAKFRLADEKVGPRGIRIRCNKCQGIFEVRRAEPAFEPPPREPLSPPPPPPSSLEVDLDDPGRVRGEVPAASPPSADPFAGINRPPMTAAVDPFAAAIGQVAPPAPFVQSDAFAPPPPPAPPLPPSTVDPFASLTLQLSSAAPSEPVPRDDPFATSNSPPTEVEGSASLPSEESGFTEPPVSPVPRESPPPLPKRETEPAIEVAPPPPSPLPAIALVLQQPLEQPAAAQAPPSQPAAPEVVTQVAEEEPAPAQRPGRPHTLLVDSMSIAVLLALALGLFVYWRGEGHGPRILQVSGLGGQEEVEAVATQISSGLYQTFDGRSLLFVRGSVRVRTPMVPSRIRVRADLLQGETVVATGESLAGALPSPEELAAITGPQDAERLRALLEQRAPSQARIGDQLPFLVLFTEFPSDIGSIHFRVNTEVAVTAAGN